MSFGLQQCQITLVLLNFKFNPRRTYTIEGLASRYDRNPWSEKTSLSLLSYPGR
jgi:hypothetical protein